MQMQTQCATCLENLRPNRELNRVWYIDSGSNLITSLSPPNYLFECVLLFTCTRFPLPHDLRLGGYH